MKNTIFLLLALMFCNIAYTQEVHTHNTNREKENLKGKVKSYIEISNIAIEKNGKITQYSKKTPYAGKLKLVFNEQGNLVEKNRYNYTKGDLYESWTFKYDKAERQTEDRRCFTDLASTKCHLNKYFYEKKANQLIVKHYENREFYPESGDDKYVRTKWIYTYDKLHNYITKVEIYRGEDDLQEVITYSYNQKGLLTEEKSVYNKKYHSTQTRKYDATDNLVEEKYYFDYDADLNKIINYYYDTQGNIIKETFRTYSGVKLYKDNIYKYEYDKKGNWKRCIKYEDDTPIRVLKRTYEYF